MRIEIFNPSIRTKYPDWSTKEPWIVRTGAAAAKGIFPTYASINKDVFQFMTPEEKKSLLIGSVGELAGALLWLTPFVPVGAIVYGIGRYQNLAVEKTARDRLLSRQNRPSKK